MKYFNELNQNEMLDVNGGSLNGLVACLSGVGLAAIGASIVFATAPVSVPALVAGSVALATGAGAANIGWWEMNRWVKW